MVVLGETQLAKYFADYTRLNFEGTDFIDKNSDILSENQSAKFWGDNTDDLSLSVVMV